MNEAQFQRLIRLSRKTGFPLVILSAEGEGSVLLPLDQYEKLVSDARPTVMAPSVASPSVMPPAREVRQPVPVYHEPALAPTDVPEEPGETETQFYLEPVE